MQELLDGTGVALVTVGFSPPEALRALADHLGLTGTVLSDERRAVYRLLGLGQAWIWQVYSPGTLAFYTRAKLRGKALPAPVEDTRQLGGDALVVDGVVVRKWQPRTPDDRVGPALLVAAATQAARRRRS